MACAEVCFVGDGDDDAVYLPDVADSVADGVAAVFVFDGVLLGEAESSAVVILILLDVESVK